MNSGTLVTKEGVFASFFCGWIAGGLEYKSLWTSEHDLSHTEEVVYVSTASGR